MSKAWRWQSCARAAVAGVVLCGLGQMQAQAASPPSASEPAKINEALASQIQATLRQRLTRMPAIDEIRPTQMPGLYEVRVDQQVFYTDAQGDFLIEGEVIETRTMRNLTQERIAKLTAIDFTQLPLKDALMWQSGQPKHRIAVFADPNCGYCKKLEQELQKVKDVTVYTFMIPILAEDSQLKAQAIWCAKDATQTWRNWMLQGQMPPKPEKADCASPVQRNLALSQKLRIQGTPAVFFEDGSRSPGLLSAGQIQEKFK